MAKTKKINLEKKAKVKPEFDEITPEQRVKSIKDGKVLKKKPKVKKDVLKSSAAEVVKNDPEAKKNLKDKKGLNQKIKDAGDNAETLGKSIKRDVVKLALINLRNGIKKEAENNTKIAKNLFDDELRYGLNIIGFKIPQCPPHTRKILLKHSLYDQKPDICFFIGDSVPKKADQNEAVRLFKEKLESAGIDYITNVMTVGQLKRDYNTHNLKLKLCNTYDVFLVESKIAEHVYSILGKSFIQKRKRPFQVDMKNENMKNTIENSLKKSNFKISPKSLISSFDIGCAKMDNGQIADNIMSTIDQLEEKWPGGWKNISRIYLRPMQPSKVSIPIYASALNPNDVEVPIIAGAKQNRLDKLNAKLKKKTQKISLDVKAKKIARNRVVKKDDESETVDNQNKRKHDDDATQQASPEKKKKKEKILEVIDNNKEATIEQTVEKRKKKSSDGGINKDKKKVQSEEKTQAVAVAEKLEKKKKKKKQEEAPPVPEPEKKKKKKKFSEDDQEERVESNNIEEEKPEMKKKKKQLEEVAGVNEKEQTKKEKKSKKNKL